jgi:hypothetical protein
METFLCIKPNTKVGSKEISVSICEIRGRIYVGQP